MTDPIGRMIFLHALTPLHTGTGQAVAIVDLPIAREKATGWPVIPGSGLKGVLRDAMDDGKNSTSTWIELAFGPPTERASDHAGGLYFTDQRILCLSVRSFFGTFAYVTCALVLTRFLRDSRAVGLTAPFDHVPTVADMTAHVASNSRLVQDDKVYLEDLDLPAQAPPEVGSIADGLASVLFFEEAERQIFRDRLAVVPDSVFDFLSETTTEVTARVRLGETKTVESGGLWYEEAVPAESFFYGPILVASHLRNRAPDLLGPFDGASERLVQIGGKASVGRGLCRLIIGGGS